MYGVLWLKYLSQFACEKQAKAVWLSNPDKMLATKGQAL
jgi:hypothetical protein